MTTYPGSGDPLSAGVMADGTTVAHRDEHGNTIGIWINAKKYLRGDGTTEPSTQLDAFQAAANGTNVFWPKGAYVFPDGYTWTVVSGQHHIGKFRNTIISVKDAYAFTDTSVSGTTDVRIDGFNISMRSGATTGGAVNTSSGSKNNWWMKDIYCDGQTTLTTPMFKLDNHIGTQLENCSSTTAPTGFYWTSASGFSNTNSMVRCRVVNANNANLYGGINAGMQFIGGQLITLRDCILESNYNGYGLYGNGAEDIHVYDCWFEANNKDNIRIVNGIAWLIQGNRIHYTLGNDVTAQHINITEATPSHAGAHRILGNHFVDAPTSGTYITIGANVENTVIIGNRKLSDAVVTDSGTRTLRLMNYDPSNALADALPNVLTPPLRVKGTTQTGDNSNLLDSALFAVSDVNGSSGEEFGVLRTGFSVFHTPNGAPSGPAIPTNSFIPYWDNATGQVKAYVRKNDGSTTTVTLG